MIRKKGRLAKILFNPPPLPPHDAAATAAFPPLPGTSSIYSLVADRRQTRLTMSKEKPMASK